MKNEQFRSLFIRRLIIGSNSISGVGELAMFCKDREAAENLQETVSLKTFISLLKSSIKTWITALKNSLDISFKRLK
jgi:hypothetical protein